MYKNSKISFKYVNRHLEKATKDYIIKEYMKHYDKRISKIQYEKLYKKMSLLIKNRDKNAFFIAINEFNEIVGSISISDYDNRIEALKPIYQNKNIAEIGRCYIKEEYRRKGVGSRLLNLASEFANEKNYQTMYLHTHYFLPGGFNFWQKMGFNITLDEKNSMQTVHMQKQIKNSQLIKQYNF